MFVFAREINGQVTFLDEDAGYVYTFPGEALAREHFNPTIKGKCSLYQVSPDLSEAVLIEQGDQPSVDRFAPTDAQKLGMWSSYVCKSLLQWVPYPEDCQCG